MSFFVVLFPGTAVLIARRACYSWEMVECIIFKLCLCCWVVSRVYLCFCCLTASGIALVSWAFSNPCNHFRVNENVSDLLSPALYMPHISPLTPVYPHFWCGFLFQWKKITCAQPVVIRPCDFRRCKEWKTSGAVNLGISLWYRRKMGSFRQSSLKIRSLAECTNLQANQIAAIYTSYAEATRKLNQWYTDKKREVRCWEKLNFKLVFVLTAERSELLPEGFRGTNVEKQLHPRRSVFPVCRWNRRK